MTEIYIRDRNANIINSYTADVIPKVGEFIYSSHMGCFYVVKVVHIVTDDRSRSRNLAGEVLSWVDVTVEDMGVGIND